MNLRRFLAQESIRLDLSPYWEEEEAFEPEEMEEEETDDDQWYGGEESETVAVTMTRTRLNQIRQHVAKDMSTLLYASGKVQNLNKLMTSLFNVEKRSSSAVGCGVAIPHVRCLQTKTIVMGFARYTSGLEYDAPDSQEVQIFIPMIAPPYDDAQYRRIYKGIAGAFLDPNVRQRLLEVEQPSEVIKILNDHLF